MTVSLLKVLEFGIALLPKCLPITDPLLAFRQACADSREKPVIPFEPKLIELLDSCRGKLAFDALRTKAIGPRAKPAIFPPFLWDHAVPKTLLEGREFSEVFLPQIVERRPVEADGVELRDLGRREEAPACSLVVGPSHADARFTAGNRFCCVPLKERFVTFELLLPFDQIWIPNETELVKAAGAIRADYILIPALDLHPGRELRICLPVERNMRMAVRAVELFELGESFLPLRVHRIPIKTDFVQPAQPFQRKLGTKTPLRDDPQPQRFAALLSTVRIAMAIPKLVIKQLEKMRQPPVFRLAEIEAQVEQPPELIEIETSKPVALESHPPRQRPQLRNIPADSAMSKTPLKPLQIPEIPLPPVLSFNAGHRYAPN